MPRMYYYSFSFMEVFIQNVYNKSHVMTTVITTTNGINYKTVKKRLFAV